MWTCVINPFNVVDEYCTHFFLFSCFFFLFPMRTIGKSMVSSCGIVWTDLVDKWQPNKYATTRYEKCNGPWIGPQKLAAHSKRTPVIRSAIENEEKLRSAYVWHVCDWDLTAAQRTHTMGTVYMTMRPVVREVRENLFVFYLFVDNKNI